MENIIEEKEEVIERVSEEREGLRLERDTLQHPLGELGDNLWDAFKEERQ